MTSSQVIYKTSIYNYYVIIPLCILGVMSLIGFVAFLSQEGVSLGMLLPLLILVVLFFNLYRLNIVVNNENLNLSLGLGWYKKKIKIKDLDLNEFKEQQVSWFLKGTVAKHDFNGHIIFHPCANKAMVLKYRNLAHAVLISTPENHNFYQALKKAQSHSTV